MSADEEPQKKSGSKRRASKQKTSVSGLSATPPKKGAKKNAQDHQVEEIIKQAFLRFYDNASIKQSKVKDLEHLDHIAEEFLKAYMILGYDLNGEKIFIMHAANPHDKDALVEHLRTTLLGLIGNN